MYTKVIKWWLTGILLILPFQYKTSLLIRPWNQELATFISRLDELTIGVLFPLALIELYREKLTDKRYLIILLSSIMTILFCGLISGALNNNALLATIHGSIDYIKYYLVIFIYAAFIKDPDDYKKVFRFVLIVTIFICVIAFIQQVWAVYYKYVLNVSADKIPHLDFGKNFIINTEKTIFSDGDWQWRFGFYRASSLMVNHTSLGMYCLLTFTIYSFVRDKWNAKVILSLLIGIISGVSRLVYGSFIIVGSFLLFRQKKWLALLIIPFVLLLYSLSSLDDFNVRELIKSVMISDHDERESRDTSKRVISYREYTRNKAIEIWKKNIMWGVGPSMYGGSLSIKYNSPYYGYSNNFMPIIAVYIKQWGTIDQFWPQVLAELGILGVALFTIFFISICMMLLSFRKKAHSPEVNKIFNGLIVYFIVILISTTVLSLVLTPVLFSYFAFVGIASGYIIRLS